MTHDSHHRRNGPLMWGAIGVTLAVLTVVYALQLDSRIFGYVVGALLVVCLAVCMAAFWMDTRADRAHTDLVDRFRNRSSQPPPGPRR